MFEILDSCPTSIVCAENGHVGCGNDGATSFGEGLSSERVGPIFRAICCSDAFKPLWSHQLAMDWKRFYTHHGH